MSKLATFRIDDTTWEKFKQWANQKDSTASNELIKFIESCLSDTDSDTDDNRLSLIDKRIDEMANRINALEQRVTATRSLDKEAEDCIDAEKKPEMISTDNPFDLNGAIALLERLKQEGVKRPNKVIAQRLNLRGYQPPNGQTKWTAKNISDWMKTGKF